MVSADLYSQFVSIHIDEEKRFTPWHLINKGKRFSDHCAIRFQMELNYGKRNQEKTKTKVWNFNDPLGWEKFRMLTGCESSVRFMWESLGNTQESYQLWKKQLNDIMHQCFHKKKIQKHKKLFNRKTRELMKERKFAKTKLSCKQLSPQSYRNLNRKIGKLNKKINANVAVSH